MSTRKKPAKSAARKALVLKCVRADMTAHGGFVWPKKGKVEAPDWNPEPVCGGGLHGWLDGEGDATACDWRDDPTARWLLVEVDPKCIVAIDRKVKFPRGVVVACGERSAIVAELMRRRPAAKPIFGTATAGNFGTATAGHGGTATAGDGGTATAGNGGTATAGYRGVLVLSRWDAVANRKRLHLFYVGENGIKPGVKYRLREDGTPKEVPAAKGAA